MQSTQLSHPNPKDRNRSILWARYAADSTEWVILSLRATEVLSSPEFVANNPAVIQPQLLVSAAIIAPGGKVLLETLIKVPEFSAKEAMEEHGIEYSVLIEAKTYADFVAAVKKIADRKQIFCWDVEATNEILTRAARIHRGETLTLPLTNVSEEYARFVGQQSPDSAQYVTPQLKGVEKSAMSESHAILKAIVEMAVGNQTSDSADSSNMGWTAEFYKPKLSAADKLKGFLGIE